MDSNLNREAPFQSFLWGGFEAASALQKHGQRLQMLADTRHDILARQDYRLLSSEGITTVRESFSWQLIDQGQGRYDFSPYQIMLRAAEDLGIQQVWSLNHFDFPDQLNILSPEAIERFAAYAVAAVKELRRYSSQTLYINPINEISFFSFMGGYVGAWAPFLEGRKNADALKQQLVKMSIAAMKAIRQVDRRVRFIQIDPVMRRVPKRPLTAGKKAILEDFLAIQFEMFELISGRKLPELGGQPEYLDLIGLNYYIANQEWITQETFKQDASQPREFIPLNHPERISFVEILEEAYVRFGRPIVITETGSYGSLRVQWWQTILTEINQAIDRGLPILGVCAYPVIDRPDWHTGQLTHSGLWDFQPGDLTCARQPHLPTLKTIRKFMHSYSGQAAPA